MPHIPDSTCSTSTTNIGTTASRKRPGGLFAIIQNDDRAIEIAWRTLVAKPNDRRTCGTAIAIRAEAVSGVGAFIANRRLSRLHTSVAARWANWKRR